MADESSNRREDLRQWRKKNFENQAAIADALGISRGYYATLENGVQATPQHIEDALRNLGFNRTSQTDGAPVSIVFGEMAPVQVIGRASAGDGITSVDHAQDELYVPAVLANIGSFGYLIDGDSMMPALQSGDIALFKSESQPRANFTYLIKNDGGEYRCKNIVWRGGQWVLESLNPNKNQYPDSSLVGWQVIGLLVGWYRSRGSYEKLESDPKGLRLDVLL